MPGGVLDTTLCDKFISDLQKVDGFPRVFRFPPSIPPRYNWNIVESGVKHHNPLTLFVVYYMDQVINEVIKNQTTILCTMHSYYQWLLNDGY